MKKPEIMKEDKPVVDVTYYDSPCGTLVLGAANGMLCLCDWCDMPCAERNMRRLQRRMNVVLREGHDAVLGKAVHELDEYFAGKRRGFDIPLMLVGTDFQRSVWQSLLEIPFGETRTYMDVACCVNNPKGVRAVAQAIGANGLSIFVPCHRVIGADNSLTGFAGGLDAKRFLLGIERGKVPTPII